MSVITTTSTKLWGSPPGATAIEFNSVSGIEVRADVVKPYGTFGKPVRPRGPVLPTFYNTVEDWVDELQRLAGKKLVALVLCSVWREAKEGDRINRHAEGKAMDIGGVWWNRDDGVTASKYYGSRHKEAVGVEASMRMFFGTVLGPSSNKAHGGENAHWHVDTGKATEISPDELRDSRRGVRKVEIVYVQDAITSVHGMDCGRIDGQWGPKTAAAFEVLMSTVNAHMINISVPTVYRAFNLATALVAFGHIEQIA